MKNKYIKLGLVGLVGTASALAAYLIQSHYAMAQPDSVPSALASLHIPADLKIEQFSNLSALGKPRMMAISPQGQLLVALSSSGRVVQLDNHGRPSVIAENLNAPNAVAVLGDDLLVSEKDAILRLPREGDHWGKPVPFVPKLATGWHSLKTVRVSPEGDVFVNVGSSCNVCVESEPTRATLLRFTREGQPAGALRTLGRHAQSPIWAHGLRNSQGFAWHPQTGELYATNNGADNRSETKNGRINDDLPPEHLNRITAGAHYGWPYCWANPGRPDEMFPDPNFPGEAGICSQAQAPAILLPAHSTPLGITFLHHSQLPTVYRDDAIVALHGSWNRKQPSGYALVRIKFRNQQPVEVVPFIDGWLTDKAVWGRPVDVIVGADGMLYMSDDKTGWIYRISPAN